MGLALGIVLECDLIVAATGTKFQVTETSEALTHRWRPFLSRLPSSCLPLRWREMDSNFRFRAFLSLRSSSVFSIPRSRSAEGTDAESGTEAISLKRKESGGLPIAVGCTRSKTGRVPCLHICWAEQCEPDILLYRSPYKCFPLEKTGCNPS
jgi:hypothetical protein